MLVDTREFRRLWLARDLLRERPSSIADRAVQDGPELSLHPAALQRW